jgi:hypothetical protein
MGEIKKNFTQGKMNKDYDVRLIPEGEYVDAENIMVFNSEGSTVGSAQNSYGVDKITNLDIDNNTSETIGSVSDEGNECLYWFVASESGNYIFEYDQKNNGLITTVLEDTRVGVSNVLNFSKQHKITGVNIVYNSFTKKKLLVWTDDLNPIRCIDIQRAKGYLPNSFDKKDIGLYKRQPTNAPDCNPVNSGDGLENNMKERFLSFGYRYKYLDGEYSAISTFSNPQFYPSGFRLNYVTHENEGMVNTFNAVEINFNTGDKNVTDVQLVFKESNSSNIWIIDTFNKNKQYWNSNESRSFVFLNNKIYSVLPDDEVNRLFDNVPLRSKSQEFIGNRLIFGNYVEGMDIVDNNGNDININYDLSFTSKSIEEYSLSSNIIDINDSGDGIEVSFLDVEIKKGNLFSLFFKSSSDHSGVYYCSLNYYIPQDFPDAYSLSLSPGFIDFINNVASNNFKNYDTNSTPPSGGIPTSIGFEIIPNVNNNIIKIKIPYTSYAIPGPATELELFAIDPDYNFGATLSDDSAFFTCKSNRSYESGLVYLDDDGRYSTVITNTFLDSNNTTFIPISKSITQNKLKLEIKHKAPYWATKYKVFIKDNKLEYQNIFGILAYDDGNYMWFKLEGQDKNKVKDGDFLIVKKDIYGSKSDLLKVQVLDVKTQSANFIDGNLLENSTDELIEKPGVYMKIKSISGLDVVSIDDNVINIHNETDSKGSNFFIYHGPFGSEEDGVFRDYKIIGGSKIDFNIINDKRGSNGGFEQFKKSFVAANDYDNIEDFFESEVGNMFPFTEYNFVRGFYGSDGFVVNPSGLLYLKIKNILNGNGQHPSYLNATTEIFTSKGMIVFETDPKDKSSEVYFETADTYDILNGNHLSNQLTIQDDKDQTTGDSAILNLSFFNCYSYGNGVESYIVKDLFNGNNLSTNTRPNAVELDGYKQRRNIASLTYSGAFEESTSYNSLNEFNLSRANYKDLDDKYGSIQKLFSRDTDLIVFQEDKVHKVLYNKNVLNDAVGGSQITSVEQVLGQEVPYSGEWGIGKDPESFSSYANSLYFTDKPKGVVLRLGGDGIEPISRYGMKDWFRDSFNNDKNKFLVGGYDPSYDNYIISFTDDVKTIDELDIKCNQIINQLSIPSNDSFLYKMNIGDKIGDFVIETENFSSVALDAYITINDRNEFIKIYPGIHTNTLTKDTRVNDVTINIVNNNESEATLSIRGNCPETPELDVVVLVVNDKYDDGTNMVNRYVWNDSVYGFDGFYSNVDSFNSSGLTRFQTFTGNETDGPIPLNGSTIRMSSVPGNGKFTNCNRLGYLVSSSDYDAQEILDNATYLPVTEDAGENYIEFTFSRTLNQKLYLVWDYIDSIQSISDGEVIGNINSGESFTFSILDYIQTASLSGSDIDIFPNSDPSHGDLLIDGYNITYDNDISSTSTFDDFSITINRDGCQIELSISIVITQLVFGNCVEYLVTNTKDPLGSGDTTINVSYIDCDSVSQVVEIPAGGAAFFCAKEGQYTVPEFGAISVEGNC